MDLKNKKLKKKNRTKFDIKIISDEIENKIQLGSSNNNKKIRIKFDIKNK